MKKIMTLIFALFIVASFSTAAIAEDVDGASSGGAITFNATNTSGPAVTYTPSPSTIIAASTSDVAYAITSASGKTDTDNGIEYGILSSSEQIYQRTQATANDVTATTSATALPGTSWKDKAGNEPGS